MTTIAANHNEMAADTRVTWEDPANSRLNSTTIVKIEYINDYIVGTSGDCAAGVRFIEWLKHGGRKPKLCRDFRALKLSSEGLFVIDGDDTTWVRIDPQFYAIGSGAHYAIGAMEMGATPEQAVAISEKHDHYTGGPITVLKLKE